MDSQVTPEYIEYVRRQIGGNDSAFKRDNREWNPERPKHLQECMGNCVRLLNPRKFVEFHASKASEFNKLGETLEVLSGSPQPWFDQDGNKALCHETLDLVVRVCLDIVDLAEGV